MGRQNGFLGSGYLGHFLQVNISWRNEEVNAWLGHLQVRETQDGSVAWGDLMCIRMRVCWREINSGPSKESVRTLVLLEHLQDVNCLPSCRLGDCKM